MKYPIAEEHIRVQTDIFDVFCNSVSEKTTANLFLSQQLYKFL